MFKERKKKKRNSHVVYFHHCSDQQLPKSSFFFVLFFCQDPCSQKQKSIYIIYCLFKLLLVSEPTITFHFMCIFFFFFFFGSTNFFGFYLLYLKKRELCFHHLELQMSFYVLNIYYLFIYSSVITQVFNNKVLMISYSTESSVWRVFDPLENISKVYFYVFLFSTDGF